MAGFSILEFLRQEEALLVHFSSPTSRHSDLVFPDDLRTAMDLQSAGLCFSTVQAGDKGPYDQSISPGEANSLGCVGMITDIRDNESVLSVHPSDGGSYLNGETGNWEVGGSFPSNESCTSSLLDRTSHNEWVVRDFIPVGIFLFSPIFVQRTKDGQEAKVPLDYVVSQFPNHRIISIVGQNYCEYENSVWAPITYDEIINPAES